MFSTLRSSLRPALQSVSKVGQHQRAFALD